jgi:hypothetical protein
MSLLSEDDSLEGKSWIEICDAEHALEEKLRNESVNKSAEYEEMENVPDELRTSENVELSKHQTESVSMDFKAPPRSRTVEGRSETNHLVAKHEEFVDKTLPVTPQKSSSAECRTPISYAKIVQGLKSESDCTPSKTETAFTEDLSITSHLDVFHVASPLKDASKKEAKANFTLDEDTIMYSPCKKEEVPVKNMKRPFQLIESPKPRPRSASDSSIHKIAKSVANSDVHSLPIEEMDENIASGSEDGKERSVDSPK